MNIAVDNQSMTNAKLDANFAFNLPIYVFKYFNLLAESFFKSSIFDVGFLESSIIDDDGFLVLNIIFILFLFFFIIII